MSVFSNDLAPNLFKSYTDWFDNWVKETGHKPEKHVDDMACRYFDALAEPTCLYDIVDDIDERTADMRGQND